MLVSAAQEAVETTHAVETAMMTEERVCGDADEGGTGER